MWPYQKKIGFAYLKQLNKHERIDTIAFGTGA